MIPLRTTVEVREIPGAVIGLIIANVMVFLVQNGLPEEFAEQFILHNALVPARYTQPDLARDLELGATNFWPFLTNTFMHAGWLHIIVNMWTLWLLGSPLEDRLGPVRFIVLYLACGVTSSLAHFAFNLDSSIPALGASGSVAGVLSGFILFYPRARIVLVTPVLFFPFVFRMTVVTYMALWFAFQILPAIAELFASEDTGGIAWWAHIGGFVAGFALVMLFGKPQQRTRIIGVEREKIREIGGQRPRIINVGALQRRYQPIGGFGKRARSRSFLSQRQRPADRSTTGTIWERAMDELSKVRELMVPPVEDADMDDSPAAQPDEFNGPQFEEEKSDDARGLATHTRETKRSIIPEAGTRRSITKE